MNVDHTIQIHEDMLPRLEADLDKLNKKATKLGCPLVSYEIIDTTRQVWEFDEWLDAGKVKDAHLKQQRLLHTVEIKGQGPVIEGWKFVGKLDHATIPGSVLVMTVPGEEIPEQFWNAPSNCEHCDTQRYRKDTFIFQHEDGTYKQVGRSCLRDFFGHDVMKVARWVEFLSNYAADLEEKDGYGCMSERGEIRKYEPATVLAVTNACIRTYGWLSKSGCKREEDVPTSYHVSDYLYPPSPLASQEYGFWKERADFIRFDEEKDQHDAEAAIAWLAEQDANNEYMHNLKALAQAELIDYRSFGLWCSLMSAYHRAMDTLAERKRLQKLNEYFGEPKQRVEAKVTCVKTSSFYNDYGMVCVHRMLTEEGHTIVWFYAGEEFKLHRGETATVKFTVKKHDEYQGWKQTIVTRLAVVSEIEECNAMF